VRDADMGGSPTFHDNRVEVQLVERVAAARVAHVAEPVGD
jgi:hypothetical protein